MMKNSRTRHAIEIFLIDDNPGDIRLTKEALKEAKLCQNLRMASAGTEALAMLRQWSEEEGALPDVILLDVNLPGMDGLDVLAEIKSDNKLKRIPVIMLSTSTAEKDLLRAYEGYANCYLVKPVSFEEFVAEITSLIHFWTHIATLPADRRSAER